jgi:hypothetical protein
MLRRTIRARDPFPSLCRDAKARWSAFVSTQLLHSGKEVFWTLLWRRPPKLAEAFVESGDLLALFDNMKTFRSDHVRYCMANAISRK